MLPTRMPRAQPILYGARAGGVELSHLDPAFSSTQNRGLSKRDRLTYNNFVFAVECGIQRIGLFPSMFDHYLSNGAA